MANNFSSNPWVVDTAFAAAPSPGHITTSYIRCTGITWESMAAAGHVVITDRNGKVIYDSTNAQANVPVVLGNPGWINGILVPTLTSGTLSIGTSKG